MLGGDSFLRCGIKCVVGLIRSLNDSHLSVMSMDRSTCPLLITRVAMNLDLEVQGFYFFLFLFIQRYTAFATLAFYSFYDWEAFIMFLSTIYDSRS